MGFPLIMSSAIAFLFVYTVTPFFIKKFKKFGLISVDLHKSETVWIPTLGGLIIMPAYILAISSTVLVFHKAFPLLIDEIAATLLVILLIGLIGGIDDLRPIRQRYKFLLPAIVSYPLVVACQGQSTAVNFPFIGPLEFGQAYWFILVPLALTTASNFTNMLAGYNGLEAGMGFIVCSTISIMAIMAGKPGVAMMSLTLAFALLAFLRYNWYPAKIFLGDSGTLLIGATIASVAIIGKMEFALMVLTVPYAIEFTLKLVAPVPFAQRYMYGDAKLQNNGTLKPPPHYRSLIHAFLLVEPLSEKQLVKRILSLEVIYALIAVLFAFSM